ncbi:MAG: alkaline phosphatase D family protein, partial [Pirellulaceae bacterium]|nr:alkaline phosphatase D family protein [Pirellulaceae bacterium]
AEAMFGIVNGDVIYEERRDGSLAGIRDNYQIYLDRGRSFNNLFRRIPALFTFDDHDVGWDIHGCGQIGLGEGRHLIRDLGLRGYEEYLSWANPRGAQSGKVRFGTAKVERGRNVLFDPDADFRSLDPATVSTIHLGNYTRGTSLKREAEAPANAGVYGLVKVIDRQHLEITPAAKADETLGYSIGTHHYYDWRISNCHFFALDTRGERSNRNPRDRADPSLFILGETQKRWLIDGVKKTDAQFVFLISPDPWTIYHTAAHVGGDDQDDKGDGFPSFTHERQQLIEFLDGIDKPVLIFTGDVHASASVKITDNVWEMMCGPLGSTGHPLGTLGNPPTGGKWNSKGQDVEIRWVTGFPNNLPYARIRNTYYGMVQVNNVLKVGRPDGRGYQWNAYDEPQVVVRWHDGYTGRLVYAESITTRDARGRE